MNPISTYSPEHSFFLTKPILFKPQPPLDARRACAEYKQSKRTPLIQLMRKLKFESIKGNLSISEAHTHARPLARALHYQLIDASWESCYIVYAPSSPDRVRKRGYNHIALIAQHLALLAHAPLYHGLHSHLRASQLESASADARAENVDERMYTSAPCEGLKLVVIDDVAITGATLAECARALKQAGAYRVYGLTLATNR